MTAPLLARFDDEMRRHPPAEPGVSIDRCDGIVRAVGSYNMIVWWDFTAADVYRRVAEQAEYFRDRGEAVEWKVYGHDGPPELTAALAAHGFAPEEPETFMAFDLARPTNDLSAPADVVIQRVRTLAELDTYIDVTTRAFGGGPRAGADGLAQRLFGADGDMFAFLAFVDGVAAAGARLELPPSRSFASMWGAGTDPAFQRRGLFRALVKERAALARDRGYSYVTVDAKETSRPILERCGFDALTNVTAWVLSPAAG